MPVADGAAGRENTTAVTHDEGGARPPVFPNFVIVFRIKRQWIARGARPGSISMNGGSGE
jgi:hypothetical protein